MLDQQRKQAVCIAAVVCDLTARLKLTRLKPTMSFVCENSSALSLDARLDVVTGCTALILYNRTSVARVFDEDRLQHAKNSPNACHPLFKDGSRSFKNSPKCVPRGVKLHLRDKQIQTSGHGLCFRFFVFLSVS